MSKRKTVVILALLVALVPKMGFPQGWEDAFYIFVGLLIALLAYLPDRVYCDECRKLVSPSAHRDQMSADMTEQQVSTQTVMKKVGKERSEQGDKASVV